MTNALSSVPLIVWATEWAWDRGRRGGIVLGAVALACQVFAGHLQDALLTIALLGVYTLFRAATETTWRGRRNVLTTASLVVVLGIMLSAVQWIPSKELLDRSPRAGGLSWERLTYGSWSPELLPTLIVREAYGTRARNTDWMDGFYPYHEMDSYLGLTALALAVIGAAASRDRWVAFWIVLTVVGSILMLGRHTLVFDLAHKIPVAGSSRIPVRFHLWVSLAVAALAAVGVDRLEHGFPVRLRAAAWLVAALIVGSLPILLYLYAPAITDTGRWSAPIHIARYRWLARELVFSTLRTLALGLLGGSAIVAAVRTRSNRVRAVAVGVMPLVVITDLLGAHWLDVPTVSPRYWTDPPASVLLMRTDPTLIRVIGSAERKSGEPGYASVPIDFMANRDQLDWSLPPVWGLKSARGETPLIARRLLEYTDNAWAGGGRFDLESVSHLVTGKRYKSDFARAMHLGEPLRAGAAFVYRNPGVFPRARLTGRPVYARDEDDALATVIRLGPEIRKRLVVEDPGRPLAVDATVSGHCRITRDDPEHVTIETDSEGPAYLVLADTFDPGWSAMVDDSPAPIRPAWIAFRAVFLQAGHHRVDFRYRPAGFTAGLALSLAGLAAGSILLILPRRQSFARPAHDLLGWSEHWPAWLVAAAVLLVVISAVKIERTGRVSLSPRWNHSVHQFTWGSGIEAMRELPRD